MKGKNKSSKIRYISTRKESQPERRQDYIYRDNGASVIGDRPIRKPKHMTVYGMDRRDVVQNKTSKSRRYVVK